MQVEIVHLPEIRVARVEHRGSEMQLGPSQQRLIQWRKANGLSPSSEHRTYICYHNDPRSTPTEDIRIDLCVSIGAPVELGDGISEGYIPSGRYARARHLGSRQQNTTAGWLYEQWLPGSAEQHDPSRPLVLHFVNMGPDIKTEEQQTDVYLPLV